MKQILLTTILLHITLLSFAQTGVLMNRYYISGSLAVGQSNRSFADSSAWMQIGNDTTDKGVLFPKVLLDSISTTRRALFVYDLKDSVLYHFDGADKVRYMTYKDTTIIKQIVDNAVPDHSNYLVNGGNAYGNVTKAGTTDEEHFDMITNDSIRVRITDNGKVLIGTTAQDSFALKVSGAIHTDSLIRMDVHNPMYVDKDVIAIKGDFHSISRLKLGLNNYGSYLKTNSLDVRTGVTENPILSLGGEAPSAGGINITGLERKVDFKGGILGEGWKVFLPEGIWTYHHTAFSFQPIEFTGNTSDQGIKLNGYSALNALQVFGATGNVGIGNVQTDNGNKLDVNGTVRAVGQVRLNSNLYYDNSNEGINISASAVAGTGISIGRLNSGYELDNIKLGHNLKGSTNNKQYIVNIGFNNDASEANHYTVLNGYGNVVTSSDAYAQIIGTSNTINYAPNSVSEGISIIGSKNRVEHAYSTIIGYNQVTTANNQLIIAQSRSNGVQCGFNDVYFGTGPRSGQSNNKGSNVTINASGAGNAIDKEGGVLRMAAGKSTGAAVPPDLIFATANSTASGSQLQSVADRWYIKGETGRLSNNLNPTSQIDVLTPNGYSQLRLRTSYTPTSTTDTNGETGDVAWDDNYIYIKTVTGWKRTPLSTF